MYIIGGDGTQRGASRIFEVHTIIFNNEDNETCGFRNIHEPFPTVHCPYLQSMKFIAPK